MWDIPTPNWGEGGQGYAYFDRRNFSETNFSV